MENALPSESLQPLTTVASTALTSPSPDRSTGLTIFGILLIVLGLMCALFMPFMLLAAVLARKTGGAMPLGAYFSSIAMYAVAAVVAITLGIGSIRARRWAWALTLVLSWIWLITGSLAIVMLTAMLPTGFLAGMRSAQANSGTAQPIPTGVMAVILTFFIAMAAIFLVVLPIAFVVFYRRKDVEETCKRRDPIERWTDRCPLPVLGASIVLLYSAAYFFLASLTTPLLPLFGRYLVGWRASVIILPLAALDAGLAYLLYRVKVAAWWIAMGILGIRLASNVATFLRADLLEAYSRMGWSDRQLQMMSSNPGIRSGVFLWWGLMATAIFAGYMIWIKRYFAPPAAIGSIEPQPSVPSPAA